MIRLIYKKIPLLFLIVIFLLEACSSTSKTPTLGSENNSKVLYIFNDRTDAEQLDDSSLKSYYTVEKGKLYARIRYIDKNSPSYNFITYLVAKISQEKVQEISTFTIDTSVHPGTIRYLSKAGSAEVVNNNSKLILSMKLKSEKINSVLDSHLKSISTLFNKISLQKVDSLSILKSYDNSWEFAENIRKRDFKAY